jgi:hypothetical protein
MWTVENINCDLCSFGAYDAWSSPFLTLFTPFQKLKAVGNRFGWQLRGSSFEKIQYLNICVYSVWCHHKMNQSNKWLNLFLFFVALENLFVTDTTYTIYHTNRHVKKSSSDYDCFYAYFTHIYMTVWLNSLMPYCLRPTISSENIQTYLSDQPYLTFFELKKNGVTSQQLQMWKAPIDVAEDYEIYLNMNYNDSTLSRNNYRYYNCSFLRTGSQCEYYFDINPVKYFSTIFRAKRQCSVLYTYAMRARTSSNLS